VTIIYLINENSEIGKPVQFMGDLQVVEIEMKEMNQFGIN